MIPPVSGQQPLRPHLLCSCGGTERGAASEKDSQPESQKPRRQGGQLAGVGGVMRGAHSHPSTRVRGRLLGEPSACMQPPHLSQTRNLRSEKTNSESATEGWGQKQTPGALTSSLEFFPCTNHCPRAWPVGKSHSIHLLRPLDEWELTFNQGSLCQALSSATYMN